MNVFHGVDLGFRTITVGAAGAASPLYEDEPTRHESGRQLVTERSVYAGKESDLLPVLTKLHEFKEIESRFFRNLSECCYPKQ